jgi:hypothetical protein
MFDISEYPENFKFNQLLHTLIKEDEHKYEDPSFASIDDLNNSYYFGGVSAYRTDQPEQLSIETSAIFGDSDQMSNSSTRFLNQNYAISNLRKSVQAIIHV